RKFLLDSGCKITYDGVFKCEKYYFVIKGERFGGSGGYSQAGLEFGRDSLGGETLKEYALAELEKNRERLENCVDGVQREKILERIKLLTEVLS
ncbi:MAG: hypothetical protein K2O81_06120, partial [Clostridia bacterium]|nr:hypothetical protein [Clostridia bacterium]